MKKLRLGLAISSALMLAACGNENETASETVEAVEVENEFAEIDEKMHEYGVAYIVGAKNHLDGLFYEGDKESYDSRTLKDEPLPSTFEQLKYYFQYRNIDNNYEIWRSNFYESEGFLLYVIRYNHERTDKHYAQPFVAEKIDGKWQIRYRGAFGFSSPHFEGEFARGKVTGSGVLRLIDLYENKAELIVTEDETKDFYNGMSEEDKQALQPYFEAWDAKDDW